MLAGGLELGQEVGDPLPAQCPDSVKDNHCGHTAKDSQGVSSASFIVTLLGSLPDNQHTIILRQSERWPGKNNSLLPAEQNRANCTKYTGRL